MGFILYNEETGRSMHYKIKDNGKIRFGKEDLELMFSGLGPCPNIDHVSREHFRITKMPSGQYVIINYSRNGICINGKRLSVSDIKNGDLIRLGPEVVDTAPAIYFLENNGSEKLDNRVSLEETVKYEPEDLKPEEGEK